MMINACCFYLLY